MPSKLLALALLSATALTGCATTGTGGGDAAPALSTERIEQDIRTLSADDFQGRGPAQPGDAKTVTYLISQMAAAGLQPGGDPQPDGKRAWTQRVPLLMTDITGTPNIRIGGKAMRQGEDVAVRAALTGANRVSINNADLVFVGYGVKAPERQWDDFKGQNLKGKILVALVNDPDFYGAIDDGGPDFGGKAMTYYGRWTYKYEEAARQGAAGVLLVHETDPASYGWATVKNSNTNTMFDVVRDDAASVHVPMEGWMQRDIAAQIMRDAGLDLEALKAQARRRDFKPVPLKAKLSADYRVKSEVITSNNVVGMLPGTERPDETVIYTGHWDHLGIGQPDARGDRIYNGAIDNATGIAALLEMGRAFASRPRTARSLVFLAVTAEEKGLLGSEYYAGNPLFALGKTAGVLNMDGMSVSGPARNFTISGVAKLGLLDQLIATGQRHGRVYTPDAHTEAGYFYRSDHFPFAKRGVPAISFGGGNDLVDGGTARGEAIAAEYRKDRYHQPADEFSPNWRYDGMTADIAMLYDLGRWLANGRDWPNWSQDSEFRAARDASAQERR